jgi:hypothetical protein
MPGLAPTHITVDLTQQVEGVLPVANGPLATVDVPGFVQPDGSSISDDPDTGEIATIGLTDTVVLAKITALGTNGSLTFTKGLVTAKVDPT